MNELYILYIESPNGKGQGLQPMGIFPTIENAKAFAHNWEQTYYTSKLKISGFKLWFSIVPYTIGKAFGSCLYNSVFQNFTAKELSDAVDSANRL